MSCSHLGNMTFGTQPGPNKDPISRQGPFVFIMNFLATFFTGFLLLKSIFAEAEGCKPACCGCDNSQDKARLRILTKQFLEDASNPATRSQADALLLDPATSMAFVQGELCSNGWYCCKFDAPITYANALLGDDAAGLFWIEGVTRESNNEYVVEALALYSYPTHDPAGSIAFRYLIRWVQTESCNLKIAGLEMVSLACQIPVDLNCAQCTA